MEPESAICNVFTALCINRRRQICHDSATSSGRTRASLLAEIIWGSVRRDPLSCSIFETRCRQPDAAHEPPQYAKVCRLGMGDPATARPITKIVLLMMPPYSRSYIRSLNHWPLSLLATAPPRVLPELGSKVLFHTGEAGEEIPNSGMMLAFANFIKSHNLV